MSENNFEEFILQKVKEEPELAEQNMALLDLYKQGLLDVTWSDEINDYNIEVSVMGKDWYYSHLAQAFTPAEA